MDYLDFYDIAVYGNENWKGNFTPREIADNAYEYKFEYDLSIDQGKPTRTMVALCNLIYEDLGGKMPDDFGITQMKGILMKG